jgi:hypothetical protein
MDNQHLSKTGRTPTPRDHRGMFQSLYENYELRELVIERGQSVEIGCTSEPLPPIEAQEQVTLRLLKLLAQAGFTWLLTTKAPHRLTDEYLQLFLDTGSVAKVSLSTFDDVVARKIEPGAIPPSCRLEEMRRIKAAGVPVVARIAPWLRTESYDYSVLEGAADAATLEFLRYSVTWRKTWPVGFWEYASGEEAPEGEMKGGTERYRWAAVKEKEYFAPFQGEGMPYHSDGYHWVMSDPKILRGILLQEREKAHAAGLKFGICNFSQGIHNIDLNDAPYCCAVSNRLKPDTLSLICQWYKDKWLGLRIPALNEENLNLMLVRAVIANSPSYRPFVLDGGNTPESYFIEQDAKERRGGSNA